MSDGKNYEQAREYAENALKKAVEGDDEAAAELAEKAKATDPQAVEDVLQELDEDATSEHDVDRINEELGNDIDKQ